MSFVFFLNKNINFCCPFCCGFDSFNIIQFKVENENNENEIALEKKEIFKKYELAEEKCNEYAENKKNLSSLGDEIFWKYFLGKLAVELILKKAKEKKLSFKKAEEKGIKEKEKEKDIKNIKEKKEVIDFIFEKYDRDVFVQIFFEEKIKDNIEAGGEKSIFDVSLDDIIFFAFLFIENVYLNETQTVPGSLDVRKYFALRNLCTFYFNPESEIKNKYVSKGRTFNPAHIIQFFNNYIETIRENKEMCINILKYFNTICEYERSRLMLSFMQEEDLVKYLFIYSELKESIIGIHATSGNDIDSGNLYEYHKEKFWGRFNNESFKFNNKDFNEIFKKIIFEKVFLKDLWDLYGQEVINSILETNNTKVTNKNGLKIEGKIEGPSVENNDEKVKNEPITQDKILKFENLKIYVGDKPEEDSFLNGFLIGLLNYRTDLVNIFKEKIKFGENDELSWKEWLSDQDKDLGNNKINFKDGFSKLPGSKEEAFDKNLTSVDKYFCRMLLFLFKILSEKNYDTINEDFRKLKNLTRQFFYVKKFLKSVDGVFDVSAPDFYNTLFSFMELMYQKFLGSIGICGEIDCNIENGEDINVKIKDSIKNEQNLIRLFFGFYYIKPGKNKNFFLKHLYCGKLDNKKGKVPLELLGELYSKKYNVVYFGYNLIVPIQIYPENDIPSNPKIQINNCEYRFKMILNPGYNSSMINENQKQNNVKNNGCSFYMLDDFFKRTINFVYCKVLNVKKNEQSVEKFINLKDVKNILQKKYVTYFFVKRFNKEEPYSAISEKNIHFDVKIQNNKNSLIKITPEELKITNDKKENTKKNKEEKKKVSPDKGKDIEQKLKKIKIFYNGSEDNGENCSNLFILPKYEVKENIFEKINNWESFMNIINNNGEQEEKKGEIEINTNENNIINENEININENNLKEYIDKYLNDYLKEITKLKPDDQNIVYSLLNCTNDLYKKLIKIINRNIGDKKTLCSIIFDKINSGKPLEFEKFDSFIKDFKEKDFEHIDKPESNVVEIFYNKWKNFMEGFPFLIQNSLLLYGVSLVLENIEKVKNIKDEKNGENVINTQMTFSKNLLQVKIILMLQSQEIPIY